MTLKEDVKYIKTIVTGIIVFCTLTIIMLSLTYGYVKELSAQNSNTQYVEIVTYSTNDTTLWYKGKAEIVNVTESQIEYIDDKGRKCYIFTNEAVTTITKYK